jgi:glycosyltransferase involved in cell wall biosynthesis
MVIVEALAAGLTVIAHDLGATPELLPDTMHSTLVAPDDPRGWDEALGLLTKNNVVDELGGINRSRYLERHTLDAWLTSHEAMYRKALGQT